MDVAAPNEGPPRRAVIAAPCAAAAAGLLAACNAGGGSSDGQPTAPPPERGTGAPVDRPARAPSPPGASTGAGAPLAKVADIPVGGGKIFQTQGVVVTQPRRGTIRAFATACPHQGCSVTKVDTTIACVCHRSRFDLADGSVLGGPAPQGLAPVPVEVTGGTIRLA